MKGFLQIMELVAPEPLPRNRFRIVEVYPTIADGMRTRITEHSFATLEEAQTFVQEHQS